MPKKLTADELRRAFMDFFADRGHTIVPSASLIPHRPDACCSRSRAWCRSSPTSSATRRRRTRGRSRSRSASGPAASTTTSTTSAAPTATSRSSRCSATSASATTSRPRRSRGRGSSYTEVLGLDADRLWVTVHETDDEAEAIWRDVVGLPAPSASSASATDNFWQHGRHRPVRAQLGDLLGPRPRVRRRTAARARRRGPLRRDLEPRVHAVRPAARRHAGAAAEAEHRHRRRPRAQPRGAAGRRRRSGTSTCFGR